MNSPRVFLALLTAHHPSRAPYRQRAREIYLKASPIPYAFIYGQPNDPNWKALPDEISFEVDDRKEFMALKDKEVCRYCLREGYDFLFRACDDTWVWPDRILKAGLEGFDYAGQVPCKFSLTGIFKVWMRYFDFMHGGCGIWLSRKAMEMIADAEWVGPEHDIPERVDIGFGITARTSKINWDDKWIGEVLKGSLKWDDPLRLNPGEAYAVNGIKVFEDDQLFQNDDPMLPIAIHDPGVLKLPADTMEDVKQQIQEQGRQKEVFLHR